MYHNDYESKNVHWVCLSGTKLNILTKKYERDYMIMTGLFSKNFKGLLISKHQSLTIDTVTSYIGTERILSYVGVSQNEDIFVKGYNCVFSWWWNFTKSKTFRRLKFNYNWILALSQSYADSHSKFCNSNSLWNNGVSWICSSFEIYAKKSQEYSR